MPADAATVPTPTPAQLAWQQAELGVVFHYDLHVFTDEHYRQDHNRRTPIPDADIFAPERLDTDQWVQCAVDMGARFAILTASHETGFRLWQSDANPYCLKALSWGDGKRDLVAEFVDSCRRARIEPGIYMGTRWNSQLRLWDFRVTEQSPITQAAYNRMIEAEVEEICSRYGPLFELWFDGGAFGPAAGGPGRRPSSSACSPTACSTTTTTVPTRAGAARRAAPCRTRAGRACPSPAPAVRARPSASTPTISTC